MINDHMEIMAKHIIPVLKSSPVLISNGSEQALPYHLTDDFIVKAHDSGQVMERNKEVGIIIIKYKDGTIQAIDTKPRIVKNGVLYAHYSSDIIMNLF
jgi:hypothetical protein